MSILNRAPHPLVVLVVDDSVDTVDSLAELLSFYGHRVRVALNGEEALRSVATEVPDVVLLDLWMPGLNGYEVAKRIRTRYAGSGKQPLLVAVTGCGTDADRIRTSESGFDLHMVKPVDPAVLVGVMERFRRLLAPTIPAAEVERPPEDPPDNKFSKASPPHEVWLKQSNELAAFAHPELQRECHRTPD